MENNKEKIEAQLAAYIDGELSSKERAEIEKHLAASPRHRVLIQEMLGHKALIQGLPRAKATLELNESLTGHLERSALLNPSEEEKSESVYRIHRWPQFAAVAAVMMLAAGLAFVVYYVLPPSNGLNNTPIAINNPKPNSNPNSNQGVTEFKRSSTDLAINPADGTNRTMSEKLAFEKLTAGKPVGSNGDKSQLESETLLRQRLLALQEAENKQNLAMKAKLDQPEVFGMRLKDSEGRPIVDANSISGKELALARDQVDRYLNRNYAFSPQAANAAYCLYVTAADPVETTTLVSSYFNSNGIAYSLDESGAKFNEQQHQALAASVLSDETRAKTALDNKTEAGVAGRKGAPGDNIRGGALDGGGRGPATPVNGLAGNATAKTTQPVVPAVALNSAFDSTSKPAFEDKTKLEKETGKGVIDGTWPEKNTVAGATEWDGRGVRKDGDGDVTTKSLQSATNGRNTVLLARMSRKQAQELSVKLSAKPGQVARFIQPMDQLAAGNRANDPLGDVKTGLNLSDWALRDYLSKKPESQRELETKRGTDGLGASNAGAGGGYGGGGTGSKTDAAVVAVPETKTKMDSISTYQENRTAGEKAAKKPENNPAEDKAARKDAPAPTDVRGVTPAASDGAKPVDASKSAADKPAPVSKTSEGTDRMKETRDAAALPPVKPATLASVLTPASTTVPTTRKAGYVDPMDEPVDVLIVLESAAAPATQPSKPPVDAEAPVKK